MYHETDRAADFMAEIGHSQELDIVIFCVPPRNMSIVLSFCHRGGGDIWGRGKGRVGSNPSEYF